MTGFDPVRMELSVPKPYHCKVRVFLVALMIALLPLRGWVGDAMALSMALGHAGTHAPEQSQTSPWHCHDSVAVANDPHEHAAHGPTDPGSHSHLLCDLCNGPVLDAPRPWNLASDEPPQLSPPFSERFASQVARRDVRPPIS